MKEFEKWWNRVLMEDDWDYEEYTLMGWKAALKWTQQKIEFGQCVAYSDADVLMALKKEIGEELNNE